MIKTILDGHPICQASCSDETLFRNAELLSAIDETFQSFTADTGYKALEQVGHVVSTVGRTPKKIYQLECTKNLLRWNVSQLIKFKEIFNRPQATGISIERLWFNRMFENSHGIRHNHFEHFDGVAVFYLTAPEHSANLLFYENQTAAEPSFSIKPHEGLLVAHSPRLFHAISKHESATPRTVMVFEFRFVD